MDPALIEAIVAAAEKPGFVTAILIGGLLLWIGLKQRVIVPGEVADLRAELAGVKAGEAACQLRCRDLEARIVALESQIMHLIPESAP